MKTIYLIGGTMGVGKTVTCKELNKKLRNSVFLDGDWCWNSDPFQVTDETKAMAQDNICYLLNNFIHCSAYANIIFCWVMHDQNIIDSLLEQLDVEDCKVINLSLVCNEKTLRERLGADVIKGIRNEEIINRSVERISLYSKLDTLKIDTSNKSILDVVKEIAALNE